MMIFNQRDRDQDGKMSFEEFSGQKTRSELAFEAIDKNGDGYVSRKERRLSAQPQPRVSFEGYSPKTSATQVCYNARGNGGSYCGRNL